MAESRVQVKLEDGTVGTVPKATFDADGGATMTPVTEEQYKVAEHVAKYGGAAGTAGAAAAGVARGLTVGLSDAALAGLGGDEMRERLEAYKEVHPYVSTGGEAAGLIAPLLLSGGAAAGAEGAELAANAARGASELGAVGKTVKAAGIIPRAVAHLGEAGEGIAEHILGEGATTATGRFLQKAGAKAVGAGIEGAAFGAGDQISEDALGNHETTAEHLITAAGFGALTAGAIGFGAGGLSSLFGHEAHTMLSKEAGAAERHMAMPAEALEGAAASKLEDVAGERAFKGLGGSAADAAKASKYGGGPAQVGRDFLNDIEAKTGKSIGFHSAESALEHAKTRVEALGEERSKLLSKLDEAKTGIAPDVKEYAARVRKELVEPNVIGREGGKPILMPGSEGKVKAVEDHLQSVEKAFGNRPPTFQEWNKVRTNLDDSVSWNARQGTAETGAIKQMRRIMVGELENAGEKAANSMGGSFAQEYTAKGKLLSSMISARDMLEKKVARGASADTFGLGAKIGAGVGGIVGGLPGAIIGGAVSSLVKKRGDFIGADLLHRASKLEILGARAAKVDAELKGGVRRLLGKPKEGIAATAHHETGIAAAGAAGGAASTSSSFADRAKQVINFKTNPAQAIDTMAKHLGDMPHYAPKTAAAITDTVVRGNDFLYHKLPKVRMATNLLRPKVEHDGKASPMEMAQFQRYAEAVDNPRVILTKAHDGTLTREHVEAVKAVYPKTYEQIKNDVITEATESENIPYKTQVKLGTLLQAPTNKTMTPSFLQEMMKTYSSSEAAATSPASGSAPKVAQVGHMELAEGLGSAGDQIEKGD